MKTDQDTFRNFPGWVLEKWQEIADILAETIGITAALISKADNEFIEVLISSQTENNPYLAGEKKKYQGRYCETVLNSQRKLVVSNACTNTAWNKNPDLKSGIIAYLGFPLNFLDNHPFGTICVLDNKEKQFTSKDEKLILQFKNVIELDLVLLQSLDLKNSQSAANVLREIVEHKRVEEALQDSEKRFRNVLQDVKSVAVQGYAPDGTTTYWNKASELLYGYTEKEAIGRNLLDLIIPPEMREHVSEGIKLMESTGQAIPSSELILRRKDGSLVPVYSHHTIVKVPGRLQELFCIDIDLTERKQAEEKLMASEQLYRNLFNQANEGLILLTMDGKIAELNNSFAQMHGYTVDEMKNMDITDLDVLREGTFSQRAEVMLRLHAGEVVRFEVEHYHKNGHSFIMSNTASIITIAGRKYFLAFHQDITERKEGNAQLEENKEKYRGLSEASFESIFLSEKGICIEQNHTAEKTFGYSNEEAIGRYGTDWIVPEDRDLVLRNMISGFEEPYEARALRKDGTTFPCMLSGKMMHYKGRDVRVTSLSDITERKRVEEELLNSERNLKESQKIAGLGTFEFDIHKGIFRTSPILREIYGIDENYDHSIRGLAALIHPDDRERVVNYLMKAIISTILTADIEFRFVRYDDRSTRWMHIIGKSEFDADGHAIILHGTAMDITEWKRVELELINAREKAEESEEKYRQIFDNTFDIMSIYEVTEDQRFKVITFNPAEAKLIGDVENYRDRYIDECIPPELYNQFKPNYERCIKAEKLIEYEEDISFLNINKTFHTQLIPLKNTEGRIHRIIVISRDITDIKLLSKQLTNQNEELKRLNIDLTLSKEKAEESELRARTYIDYAPDGICIIDSDGLYLKVNQEFTNLFGYSEKEMLNGFKTPLVVKEDLAKAKNYNKKLLRDGKCSEEFLFVTKAGTVFHGLMSSVKVLENQFLAFIKNISVLKETEKELVNAKQKAEESDKLKSAFLSNMAHEIRTPMNGILGFSALLKAPDLSGEQQQQYIRIIEKSGNRMLNIIDEIIEISKIEAGLMQIDNKDTDLNEKFDFIYAFFKPEAEAKGLKLSIGATMPVKKAIIKTDSLKFYSILTNLIKNAIKYTDKGSIEFGFREVNKKKADQGTWLKFYVKDTGIGIPHERHHAIFERFIQADIADIQARQGAGLGLSIAKAYVELLGGKIWVESLKGKGSTFYFTLPYTPAPVYKSSITNLASPGNTGTNDKNLNILIVEDDETSEILLDITVEKIGKEIIKARSGKEAVEICRIRTDIDLILMDIQMPVLNGYDATRQIRLFNKDVIIIAQTAFAQTGDRKKAIEAGCNEYITKPIDKDILLDLIQKQFSK